MIRKLCMLAIFGFAFSSAKAQHPFDTAADSLLTRHLRRIGHTVDSILSNPNRFISGTFYYPVGNRDNHPFFLEFYWKPGWVKYEGEEYPVAMMKYDIEKDAVVMMEVIDNLGYPIQLVIEAIPEFSIEGHHFVYMEKVKKPGYYEPLNNSATKVWARWVKWSKESANPVTGKSMYAGKIYYLIHKDNAYYDVRRPKEIYNIFSDQKKALRRFKKENRLSFRRDMTNAIVAITEQYDNLNN